MKIALYGGSFDPIHNGHVAVIKEILNNLDIDRLVVVPTFLNPFKSSSSADAHKRLEWIKSVLCGIKNVEISTYEIDNQKATPTIDSVEFFYQEYDIDKLYLIIGADNLEKLHMWKDYDKLKNMVEFVVAKRDNISIDTKYKVLNVDVDINSTSIRELKNIEHIPQTIVDEVKKFYKNEDKGV
jgi:nicotinate-nucleotide adenylyltransferase